MNNNSIIAGLFTSVISLIGAFIINDWAVWYVWGIGIILTFLLIGIYEKYETRIPLSYIPNVWTGLGVFFTFIVIWYNLSSENFDFSSTGIDKGKDLEELVKSLAKAFSSSIIGILGSIISSVAIKILLSYQEHQQEKDNKIAYTSPEVTLWDLKTNNESQLNELKTEINNLHTLFSKSDLPRKFYKEILLHKQETQGVRELLSRIPTDFKDQLKTLIDDLNTKLEEVISNMGQTALGQARGNIEDINKELKGVMAELIEASKKQLEGNLTQLKATTDTSKETLESVVKTLNEKVDEMGNHYKANAQNIETKFVTTYHPKLRIFCKT